MPTESIQSLNNNRSYREGYDLGRNGTVGKKAVTSLISNLRDGSTFAKGYRQGGNDKVSYGPQNTNSVHPTRPTSEGVEASIGGASYGERGEVPVPDAIAMAPFAVIALFFFLIIEGGWQGWVGALSIVGYFWFSLWYVGEIQVHPGQLDGTKFDTLGEILLFLATIPAVLTTIAFVLVVGIPLAVIIVILGLLGGILF